MGKGLLMTIILDFIKEKEKIELDEIKNYVKNMAITKDYMQTYISDIDDTIFDLIVDGILKVGIVYSYGSSSSQYFVDKEKLMMRFTSAN